MGIRLGTDSGLQPASGGGGRQYSKSSTPGGPKIHKKKETFRVGAKPFSEEDAERWMKTMSGYENEADNEIVRNAALNYIRDISDWYEQRMLRIYDHWQALDFMLRGNSLSTWFPNSDIHVPEVYKMLEGLVPRIVEAIKSYDPWFHIEGRDQAMDKRQAQRVQAWLRYLMESENLDGRLEEIIRDMLVYKAFIIKDWWAIEYQEQVVPTVTKSYEGSEIKTEVKNNKEMVQTFEGLRFKLVDPYDFICDIRETCVHNMEFVGDRRTMNLMELRQMAKLQGWQNMDEAENSYDRRDAIWTSGWAKNARSFDATWEMDRNRIAEGQPKKYQVQEIWCKWRPTEDHDFEEWVLTCVNRKAIVRAQRNPHNNKHRPYSVGRASKFGHEFWNTGPLDMAVTINKEFDDHRNLSLRSHALAQTPFVWTDSASDLPDNVFDLDPGSVLQTDSPPTFFKTASTIGEMQALEMTLRRDIEEVTGAVRIHEGAGAQTTATEVERKIQEGNRRIRQLVINASDGLVNLLMNAHAKSGQYLTETKLFRVMSGDGWGSGYGTYEVGPEDFTPIDIKIQGVKGLQSYGMRATQIVTFLSQAGPLLQTLAQSGDLNIPGLVAELYYNLLGYRLSDDILQVPPGLDNMVPAPVENLIFLQGNPVKVHPQDPDAQHIAAHAEAVAETEDTKIQLMLAEHIEAHKIQMMMKKAKEQAVGDPQAAFNPGQAATPMQPQTGRYDQGRDMMGQQPGGQVPRETPGPARPGSMSAPDRAQATPQMENM